MTRNLTPDQAEKIGVKMGQEVRYKKKIHRLGTLLLKERQNLVNG